MKLLIVGKNGQVGSSLVSLIPPPYEFMAFSKEDLDITSIDVVEKRMISFKPDFIINAAAYTDVDNAEDDAERAYAVNHLGVKNLVNVANQLNAVLIHISTDYVFSGKKEDVYFEHDTTGPLSVYGKSKLAGENEIINYCKKYIILRTSWVFSNYGNNFVKTMLRLAETKNELSIVSDQYGSPTYAKDIALAIFDIINQLGINNSDDRYDIYHYSGSPYCSWYDFAEAIFENAKNIGIVASVPKLKKISTEDYHTKATRPRNSMLSTNLIKETFNINTSDWNLALDELLKELNKK